MKFYIKTIIPIWGLGFLADILGTAYLVLTGLSVNSLTAEQCNNSPFKHILNGIRDAVNYSIFDNTWGFLFILSGIIIAGLLIFLFDRGYLNMVASDELTKSQRLKIALGFAICTAPYTFLLPRTLFM